MAVIKETIAKNEWWWQGGSGTVGKRRSRRFEWYQRQCGSGSIGRVAMESKIAKKSGSEWQNGSDTKRAAEKKRVAVAGWQWYRWKEEVSAVILVQKSSQKVVKLTETRVFIVKYHAISICETMHFLKNHQKKPKIAQKSPKTPKNRPQIVSKPQKSPQKHH
jgi:hypothetical protein